ncbi:thioesterase domain-containing protein [Solirubrobacter phytolaccae]|uniref:Thioesterase domain-containing protein n=1 Tax=Solirubrobacter phytolaccae TaxID=1404360 RepID=A0A9X3N8A4_9ACTN|nr:thioesterase domain-containing protein [Solirubrobacter phytolaccae]MDA0181319.1 thioesterase domain-containing protein [Solirubrobacter phytolaccae]
MTELCVIHPGELSPLCWPRLGRHLPAGTRLRVLELEALNGYWEHDPNTTVDSMADRLRLTLDPRQPRVLVGWGVGGVVAEALAARLTRPPRHTILLDSIAPGMSGKPTDAELVRSYAQLVSARRGRDLELEETELDPLVERLSQHGFGAPEALRKGFFQHQRARAYGYRLISRHEPAGVPVTVVQPVDSLYEDLGWDARIELLAAGGDHYTMLTDPANMVNLALLLTRWLSPAYAAA